jgi:hypothetical protein
MRFRARRTFTLVWPLPRVASLSTSKKAT